VGGEEPEGLHSRQVQQRGWVVVPCSSTSTASSSASSSPPFTAAPHKARSKSLLPLLHLVLDARAAFIRCVPLLLGLPRHSCADERTTMMVYLLGNPLVLWLVAATIFLWFTTCALYLRYRNESWFAKDKAKRLALCRCACLSVRRWVDGWMGGWVDGWMGGWVDGWMGGWYGTVPPSTHPHTTSMHHTARPPVDRIQRLVGSGRWCGGGAVDPCPRRTNGVAALSCRVWCAASYSRAGCSTSCRTWRWSDRRSSTTTCPACCTASSSPPSSSISSLEGG
jgi:hypothetical protein